MAESYHRTKMTYITKKYHSYNKVLVIPFVHVEKTGQTRFLVVRDSKHQEFTFISGCLKRNEDPTHGARRELYEETRGSVNIEFNDYHHWKYNFSMKTHNTYYDGNRYIDAEIDTKYWVYIIDISDYMGISNVIWQFNMSKIKEREYLECDQLFFDTLETFKKKKLWSFIKDVVLDNKSFEKILRYINKKNDIAELYHNEP